MPITASDLYDYVQCPHRVTMNVVGDPAERDPVSPFVEFLWERGNAYEREVIARLGQVANALADAEIVAVDWEPVLAVARANAERAGIIKRYRTVVGSAFDVDWGKSYDLAPLPNFLHHFDYATCVGLLKKVRQSLASNGKTLVVEFVLTRIGSPLMFRLPLPSTCWHSPPQGDAYTAKGLDAMARDAGFSATVTSIAGSPESLVSLEQQEGSTCRAGRY